MNNNDRLIKLENLLKKENADYAIFKDNVNLETAIKGAKYYRISLEETTPTFILKSKSNYFAAIICGNMRISFKKLKNFLNIIDLSMANPQEVFNFTGARIGEVSLINVGIVTYIDINVLKNVSCYGGCGISKATLRINTNDLIRITNAQVFDFAETCS